MSPEAFLECCGRIAQGAILLALGLTLVRLLRGPSLADRVVALDMLTLLGIGLIGVSSVLGREYAYLDVAISLALVGFLATVAFARYIYRHDRAPRPRRGRRGEGGA
jgi:multicomponent Na+:H+ antiporter subunit F